MKVQRIHVDNKEYPLYILIDGNYEIVQPVLKYIKYLDNTGKSPNTIKSYCYHLKLFYVFMEQSNITLEMVNFEEMSNFVGWLMNPSGDIKVTNLQEKKSKREESTVNTIINAVTSYFEYLVRLECVKISDVFREKRGRSFKGFLHHVSKGSTYSKNILKLRDKKKRKKTLDFSEVSAIMNACHTYRDKLILLLMYEGGLRIGEVLSLRLEDVVTWDNEIHITPREENINDAYVKFRKERVIHVSKELMSLYTNYLVHEYCEELNHDCVFIVLKDSHFGKPLKYQSVLELIRRLRKRTGISFNPHMLRHTHATELIRNGWDVAYVQNRLGHANVQTTLNTYVHLSDQDMKNEYSKYLKGREQKGDGKIE